mmetsp:Transcript_45783/g.89471  ORF Transcript_45783/g.89471 Transcript_45783/m.89471 type:complete len:469 (-) Transcript_45783:329-1735(-)
MPRPHPRNDQYFIRSVLLVGDPLRLLHQQRPEALVLKFGGVPFRHPHRRPVDVQLPHDRRRHFGDLRPEGHVARLPEPQQADEDVLLHVLVGQEGLPAPVGDVVTADQLHVFGEDALVDLFHADLPAPDVLAGDVEVAHPLQGELAEVSVFYPAGDEGHGYVPLDPIDAGPRGHHGKYGGGEFHELVGSVVSVRALFPEFVEARAADDQRGVQFEAVRPEEGVFKVFAEPLEIPLHPHIGQIRHHVADHLEPAVLREMKRVHNGGHRVSPVGLLRHRLVHALHPDLDAGTSVSEHLVQMRPQAVVGPGLDGDADALADPVLPVRHGLLHARTAVPAARVVQVADKKILVLPVQAQERPPHHDVLHLVHAVPERPQLRHPAPRLRVRVVARPDRPHRRRLVPRVRLRGVLEVAVGAAGAVGAHVARQGDVRAPVRFRHERHHRDARGGADGLLQQIRRELLPVGQRERR